MVNIDYRLTPEYKWPTQLEDSMKVYKWVSNIYLPVETRYINAQIYRPLPMPHLSRVMPIRSIPLGAPLAAPWLCRLLYRYLRIQN